MQESQKNKTVSVQYDTLQKLYLQLSPNTTKEEIENYITQNNLKFTKRAEFCYKIAYDKEVAYQDHAKEGDNIYLFFHEKANKSEYYLCNGEYSNHKTMTTAKFQEIKGVFKHSFCYLKKGTGRIEEEACSSALSAIDKTINYEKN